jgi:hypothetical protein
MKDTSVQNPNADIVNTDVGPQQHEEAIVLNSIADICLAVAFVAIFIFVECDLTVMQDWIVDSQHVNRDFCVLMQDTSCFVWCCI